MKGIPPVILERTRPFIRETLAGFPMAALPPVPAFPACLQGGAPLTLSPTRREGASGACRALSSQFCAGRSSGPGSVVPAHPKGHQVPASPNRAQTQGNSASRFSSRASRRKPLVSVPGSLYKPQRPH